MGSTETLSLTIVIIFGVLMLAGTLRDIVATSRKVPPSPEVQAQLDTFRLQLKLDAADLEIRHLESALAQCRDVVAAKLGNEGLQILDSTVHIGGDAVGGSKRGGVE